MYLLRPAIAGVGDSGPLAGLFLLRRRWTVLAASTLVASASTTGVRVGVIEPRYDVPVPLTAQVRHRPCCARASTGPATRQGLVFTKTFM